MTREGLQEGTRVQTNSHPVFCFSHPHSPETSVGTKWDGTSSYWKTYRRKRGEKEKKTSTMVGHREDTTIRITRQHKWRFPQTVFKPTWNYSQVRRKRQNKTLFCFPDTFQFGVQRLDDMSAPPRTRASFEPPDVPQSFLWSVRSPSRYINSILCHTDDISTTQYNTNTHWKQTRTKQKLWQ